jgi:hypothetical protein
MKNCYLLPEQKKELYNYLRKQGVPHLTIKILLGYSPDGIDRLTILLGQGSKYDYQLLENENFRLKELDRYFKESSLGN